MKIIEADLTNTKHAKAILYLLNEYAKGLLGYKKGLEDKVIKDIIPGLVKFEKSIIFLAETDNIFAGIAVCFLGFSTFNAKSIINIHDLGVLKEHRNKGIGRKLLDEIRKKAEELNCCKITLEVQEKNSNAISVYKKYGFKESFLNKEAGGQLFLTKEI